MQVVHPFTDIFIHLLEEAEFKHIGIYRREPGLDPDFDNAGFVLFPVFCLPPLFLLLLFIAVASTRWHQPPGTVLHAEPGWGAGDDPRRE